MIGSGTISVGGIVSTMLSVSSQVLSKIVFFYLLFHDGTALEFSDGTYLLLG